MFRNYHFSFHDILIFVLIVVFVIFKIPYLSLPYYWDEAWVYGPALRIMESGQLSLLPDALPVYYSRGHPLLFHFMGALWLKIFGTSLLSSHIFALCISVGLILSVYIFCSKLFSKTCGITACVLLSLQPIFLAQSVLVLPEVMLSLFTLLSLFFFIRKKWLWYIIFTTFALYTKETGVVVIAATGLWFLIENLILNRKEFILKKVLLQCLYLFIPVLLISLFFLLQKETNGWYFFPEHINYLQNDSRSFLSKFESYVNALFIYWGRNMLTTLIIVTLFLYFFRKKYKNNEANRVLLLLAVFIILFMVTGSFNFFSDRYAMCMMAPFVIIVSILLHQTITKKILAHAVILVYAVLQILIYIPKKTSSDHNLGYAESVKTYQQTVNYCIENNFAKKKIFTHFLMLRSLADPYCGYLNENEKYTNISSMNSDTTEIYIFSNLEGKEDYEKIKAEGKIKLLKRFESYQAWVEIWGVIK